MNIFDNNPETWQELQEMVGILFSEIGCNVEVGKTVELVRGAKEIDVYVEDATSTPHSKYLCECKFWSKAIPQEVVHAFRTVVSDFGANQGFVISKVGFQPGCLRAVENTNIQLMTFDDLYMPYADSLFPYWDPVGGRMPKVKWTDVDVEHQRLLIDAYLPLVRLGPMDAALGFRRKFPIELPILNDSFEIEGEEIIKTHREYFDFVEANKEKALRQFQILYGERNA